MSQAILNTIAIYIFTGLALHKISMPPDGSDGFSNVEVFAFNHCFDVAASLSNY